MECQAVKLGVGQIDVLTKKKNIRIIFWYCKLGITCTVYICLKISAFVIHFKLVKNHHVLKKTSSDFLVSLESTANIHYQYNYLQFKKEKQNVQL